MRYIVSTVILCFLAVGLSGCSKKTKSTSVEPTVVVSTQPTSVNVTPSGKVWDGNTRFAYVDEETQWIISYPNVFSSQGEADETGIVKFPSEHGETTLLYWSTPNSYHDTPASFMERVLALDMKELDSNVVIGKSEEINQDTGEKTPCANFWVVDQDWIVNVSILCKSSEDVAKWYDLLHDSAVYVESVVGMDLNADPNEITEENDTQSTDLINARLGFITQEYVGNHIAEIPYIEYDTDSNPEIDSINRMLNQGLQRKYDDFMQDTTQGGWIEIKSYPFTSPEYIQVVVTSCIYPNYASDGDMYSINYDKLENKGITVDEEMEKLGLSKEELTEAVIRLFEPESSDQSVGEVAAVGFLIREGNDGQFTQLLLEITVGSSETEDWKYYYSYTPMFDELYKLNSYCLFDPYDMDQMEPPLSYQ